MGPHPISGTGGASHPCTRNHTCFPCQKIARLSPRARPLSLGDRASSQEPALCVSAKPRCVRKTHAKLAAAKPQRAECSFTPTIWYASDRGSRLAPDSVVGGEQRQRFRLARLPLHCHGRPALRPCSELRVYGTRRAQQRPQELSHMREISGTSALPPAGDHGRKAQS